ncbi:MAG TPA: Hsp70 family protein, partial [Thermoanaerobaculia bacterium]|nr:Hsp70 family protein [Thermoanaerobaculia bacterium]
MRIGIDFGTTHTVAALVDRGNYPVVAFEGGDVFPSVAAVETATGRLRFGTRALAAAERPGWRPIRSFKRLLAGAGPGTRVALGPHEMPLLDLLTGHFAALGRELVEGSNAGVRAGEPLVAAVSVPANASSDQRFLTLEAFRRAGFEVVAVLNEPSATGFEYARRFGRTLTSRREHVVVYDLGGGTFDVSLLHMAGLANEVLASAGMPRLGGDDFDAALAALVAERAGLGRLAGEAGALLLEECRRQKERLLPQSRRFVVDLAALGLPPLALPVEEAYEACRPLVERTLALVDEVLGVPGVSGVSGVSGLGGGTGWEEVAGLYVAGGASGFPPVLRQLRERHGERRVRRSPHPFAATAIGLACFLDEESGVTLSDVLSRTFGVFREARGGQEVAFDPVFLRDTALPAPGAPPLESGGR